jgi:hypothetical protein
MKPDLEDLKIAAKEIEGLTGFEVNEIFIGAMPSGTYRPSVFQNLKQLLSFGFTQLFVAALTFIFTLPIGLWLIRGTTQSIRDVSAILPFLLVTSGTTAIVLLAWNFYMVIKVRSLKTLAHLLDKIDHFNDVIQAVDVLDNLRAAGKQPAIAVDREQVLEALSIARKSLVCGLVTERILRQNRKLLARRYELFANVESNLAALRTLEVDNQAGEYAELLNQAFQIGLSVHQEVQQIVGE